MTMTLALSAHRTPAPVTAPCRRTGLERACAGGLVAISRLTGLRVRIARTPAALDDADAVAAAVLGDRRATMPLELRHIEARYARMSTTLVAYHRGRPVGALTLYLPTDSSRTIESAPLRLPDGIRPWQVVDIGRLAILPSHRGGNRLVLLGLLEAAQRISIETGRPWWVGMTSPGLFDVFGRLNPTVRELPLAFSDRRSPALLRYWSIYREGGGARRPFILDVTRSSASEVVPAHLARLLRRRLGQAAR